ncbi:unnamed protein product [Lampetra planeri]
MSVVSRAFPDDRSLSVQMHINDSQQQQQLFSYFTEVVQASTHRRTEHLVAQTLVLALIFLTAVSTNALLAVVLIKNARSLSPTACLVLHLTLADLLFVSAVPTVTLGRWRESWNFGVPVCKGVMYTLGLGISSMLYALAAISVCRQLCVNRAPGRALDVRFPGGTKGLVVVVSVVIVALSAAGAVPVAVYFQVVAVQVKNHTVDICTFVSPASVSYAWFAPLSILAFLVPLLFMVVNYCRIFKTVRQSRDRTWNNGLNLGLQPKQQHRASRSLRKLLRSLMLLVTSFFIFWLPLFVTVWLMYLDRAASSRVEKLSTPAFTWVAIIAFANTCLNPLLYGFSNRRIRAMLARSCPTCGSPANRVDPGGERRDGGDGRRQWRKRSGSGRVPATVSYIEDSNEEYSQIEET